MAKPSQLQQPGVERATRDTPGKEKQKSDPGGIAALRLRRRRLVGSVVAAIPPGSSIENGKPGVSRGANPRLL